MGRLTHTVSGSIATVRSPAVAPIESLKVHFSPIQEGTGDPSPSNVRPITGWTGVTGYKSGKNLFDISKFKGKDGITVTGNSMTGTAVAFREAYNVSNNILYPLYIPAGSKVTIQFLSNSDGGNTAGAGFSINLYYSTDSDDSIRAFYTNNSETTPTYHSGTITLAKDVVGLAFVYYNNALANTWTVSDIQIEIGSTATEYEPYKSYETIPVTFPNFSTNLFDPTDETFVNISKSNGVYSNSDVDSRTYAQFEIQLYNNTTLLSTLSPHNFTGTGLMSFDFNVNNPLCNLICFKHNGVTKDFRIRFPFTYGMGIYTISCNIISNDPTTVGGLQLSDISIKRGNKNVIDYANNTIYGGYVDLATGNVYSTYYCLEKAVADMDNNESYPGWKSAISRSIVGTINDQITGAFSNICPVGHWNLAANTIYNDPGTLLLPTSRYNLTQTEWKETYPDLVIKFMIPYQTLQLIATLTPQELATFKGYSNFWSNAGDVDVTYQVVESSEMTKERQKIFAGNAPSIHTASGSVANFEMEPGLNRNLKSCKVGFLPVQEGSGDPFPPINQNGSIVGVNNLHNESELSSFKIHFSPIQSGSGDPSPTNVRPITGWTGVTGYKGGKNLYSAGDQTFTQSRRVQIGQMIKPGTYTLSLEVTSDDTDSSGCLVYLYNGTTSTGISHLFSRSSRNSWTFTIDVEFDCLYLYSSQRWVDGEGDTATFSNIQLEAGITATSYEAYSAPTSYPITFPGVGKNLFDQTKYSDTNNYPDSYNNYKYTDIIMLEPNTTYTFASNATSSITSGTYYVIFVNTGTDLYSFENKNFYYPVYNGNFSGTGVTNQFTTGSTGVIRFGFPVNEDITELMSVNWQLELGSSATTYEPFNNTIYGGYVDAVTGDVYKTHEIVDLGTLNYTYDSTAEQFVCYSGITFGDRDSFICSNYKTKSVVTYWTEMIDKTISGHSTDHSVFRIKDTDYTDAASFKTAMNGVKLTYELITPVKVGTISSTNVPLTNGAVYSFWSNADTVTIETVGNVRPIKGWGKLNICSSKQNIFDPNELTTININGSNRNAVAYTSPGTYKLKAYGSGTEAYLSGIVKNYDGTWSSVYYVVGNTYAQNMSITIVNGQTLYVYDMQNSPKETSISRFVSWQFQVSLGNSFLDSYESYSGSKYSIEFPVQGKNLLDVSNITHGSYNIGSIPNILEPNTTYTFSVNGDTNKTYRLFAVMEDYNTGVGSGISLNASYINKTSNLSFRTFTTPANIKDYPYLALAGNDGSAGNVPINDIKPQVELGSTATSYEPYDNTILGGYVNLVTGEVWKTHICETANDKGWLITASGAGQSGHSKGTITNALPDGSESICTHWKNISSAQEDINKINHNNYFWLCKKFLNSIGLYGSEITAENINRYLASQAKNGTPVYISSPLETPVLVTTLTPTQIQALKGTNNILSDANSIIEVKYWSH